MADVLPFPIKATAQTRRSLVMDAVRNVTALKAELQKALDAADGVATDALVRTVRADIDRAQAALTAADIQWGSE
jgi:hypothetical protein